MRSASNRGLVLGVVLAVSGSALAQPPAARPATPPPADDNAARPVAYINGNVPVTRGELGEFLMARGGFDKLELLINKKIIEHECARRGVTVTEKELEAAFLEDLEGIQVKKADFVSAVLPRYGKTLYEWMEDVVRPRILLTKLCRDRVKVDPNDLKIQYEREYGEKRRVQIIMWPKGDNLKVIQDEYGKLRENAAEFDRAARAMANPALAASAGHIKPISKHLTANDKIVEEVAFQLKPGEISQILSTSQGYLVMKLHEVIPPDTKVTYEAARAKLEKQAYDEKLTAEIPKFFAELKEKAAPNLLYFGPTQWKADMKDEVLKGPPNPMPEKK